VRFHLGHHFYGAGNLGDDFMLAGFLAALRPLAPRAEFTCCVPFDLAPLRARFPAVHWLPCDDANRAQAIAACDVWLGLGGSPFQSAQSRWFVDHLIGEATVCAARRKPMFYLGIGVQTAAELALPEVRDLCAGAAGIWTRDAASAERLRALGGSTPITAAADLAHILFRDTPPPGAGPGRVTLVPNFDYGAWPGQSACLRALQQLPARDRVWLAQESRELPGAERALYAALPAEEQARWRLVSPEMGGAPLPQVLARWPSGEWLVTSRYHAAVAGVWAGSKVVIVATNEKLRGAAAELRLPALAPDAETDAVKAALATARPAPPPVALAEAAYAACAAMVRLASGART
jgi:hypothetical protein